MDPRSCDGSRGQFDPITASCTVCGQIAGRDDYQRHLAEKYRREGRSQDQFRGAEINA